MAGPRPVPVERVRRSAHCEATGRNRAPPGAELSGVLSQRPATEGLKKGGFLHRFSMFQQRNHMEITYGITGFETAKLFNICYMFIFRLISFLCN
jgi:hypothetical protein